MSGEETLPERLRRMAAVGRVEWIGLSPGRRQAIQEVREARAEPGTGLAGDHHGSGGGKRQVTLLQAEHLPAIAALCGQPEVRPEQTRRNLLVSGINVYALRNRCFRAGGALLEGTGPCPPCSRMEESIGAGAFQAMRGHGGITAVVHEGGTIRAGDAVAVVAEEPEP